MQNKKIADMFERIADILEIQGEIPFKVNAYRRASRIINELQDDIEILWRDKKLRELPGIGDALVKKIDEFLTTGSMKKYQEVSGQIPETLLELLNIQSMGPKTIGLAYKSLHIKNLQDLKKVIDNGALAELPGMGAKKIENIRQGIDLYLMSQSRISIGEALPVVEQLIRELKEKPDVLKISPAGSTRRMKETVGDVDILVATENGKRVIDAFVKLPMVSRILGSGETKGSVLLENGLQVDLRAVKPDSYGAAMQYFTGSQAHNVKLRGIARARGLRINEYGIFKGDEKLGGAVESEIYNTLGLPYIPPELREDRGEIEAAATGNLPNLLELSDIRGDLHLHTTYSDGHGSIEQMVQKAIQLGYEYLAICDHSQSVHYANGVSEERLLQQMHEIDELNRRYENIYILKGSEVDILSDGRLDFPDSILEQLDVVVASIHTGFKQNVTQRILKAMENPHVKIIAHPTGRLISRREGYQVDLKEVFKQAVKTNTALEINAFPDRLDLSDMNAKTAVEMGVKLVIDTDAHQPEHLDYMKFGVGTARRGWIEKTSIMNTHPYEMIKKLRS